MQAITGIAQAVSTGMSAMEAGTGIGAGTDALSGTGGEGSTAAGMGAAGAPFAGLVTGAVKSMNALNQQAASLTEGLIEGTGVDIHQAMIATEKAEQAFELALAVRNKAVAAYQQVMNLQF